MNGVQQDIYSILALYTTSLSSEGIELGDEPTQLRRIAYAIEAQLFQV
jgi:hypothetical protein